MSVSRRFIFSGIVLICLASGRADAAALDPTLPLFTAQSQGDVTLLGGRYQFLLGTNGPSLISLSGPTFTTVATGFIYNGINVFDFHSLNIGAGANIATIQSSASGPIALLSSTSINMAGSIDVSATQLTTSGLLGGPGAGNTGVGGNGNAFDLGYGDATRSGSLFSGAGGGGFGGFGQQGQSHPYQTGFPSFLSGTVPGGAGGGHYENLADRLQGGSAGGFGIGRDFGSPVAPGAPGLGGGAIELGAVGTLSVSGSITANGSNGFAGDAAYPVTSGGGGSGGGVFLHGNSVDLSGTISALGGAGGLSNGFYAGGAGSGGLILAQYNNAYGTFTNTGTVNVGSGATVGRFDVQSVPEPSSLILLGMSALGGIVATGLRRHRR